MALRGVRTRLMHMSEELSAVAAASPALSHARIVAEWVGEKGKPVTAGGALKPGQVPAVASALGVKSPSKVGRASKVPEVYRAWLAAVGAGLVKVDGGRVTREAEAARRDVLDAWFGGLEAVLQNQVFDPAKADPRIVGYLVLTILDADRPPSDEVLEKSIDDLMRERGDWHFYSYRSYHTSAHPAETVIDILRSFGAVGEDRRPTPLGRWARDRLQGLIPPAIGPSLPAREFLAYLVTLDDAQDPTNLIMRWAGFRDVGDVARELLLAARDATPAERVAAVSIVDGLGKSAIPVWHEFTRAPAVAPHARVALATFEQETEPDEADRVWVAVDFGLMYLDRNGAADAWYSMRDILGDDGGDDDGGDIVAALRDSGHPESGRLVEALQLHRQTVTRTPVQQLRISLRHTGIWRRVLMPEDATLGDLHQVIGAVLGWGIDHLHAFTVGEYEYSDPYFNLDNCDDEDSVRLNRALPKPGSKIVYVYDFGDDWRHEITLEKVFVPDEEPEHPVCTGGVGDNPIEDYDPEDPEDPVPFDRDVVNGYLAAMRPRIDLEAVGAGVGTDAETGATDVGDDD
jgi:hypothetical protein